MNIDRAAALADFLASEARGMKAEQFGPIIEQRWPNISDDEIARGFAIADETLRAEAAEHFAEAASLHELAARRRRGRA